jgi:hypothetical protein
MKGEPSYTRTVYCRPIRRTDRELIVEEDTSRGDLKAETESE